MPFAEPPARLALAGSLAGSLAGALALLALPAAAQQVVPKASAEEPQVTACRASGLLALREKSPDITDLFIDPDALTIAKADTKVEDTPVKGVLLGEAYVARGKGEKPYQFVCLVGEKGKVLLTFFTQR